MDPEEVKEEEELEEQVDNTDAGEGQEPDDPQDIVEDDGDDPAAEPEDDSGEESKEEPQEEIDFQTYLKDRGLEYSDPDQLLDSYDDLKQKVEANNASAEFSNRVGSLLSRIGSTPDDLIENLERIANGQTPNQQPPQGGGGQYGGQVLNRPGYTEALDQFTKSNFIDGDQSAYLMPVMQVLDLVRQQDMAYIDSLFQQGNQQVKQTLSETKDDSDWAAFKREQPNATEKDRSELRSIKKAHRFDNYIDALLWKRVRDPKYLEQRLKNNGGKPKNRRIKFMKRKSGSSGSSGFNIDKYFSNGIYDGDALLEDLDAGKITQAQYKQVYNKAIGKG